MYLKCKAHMCDTWFHCHWPSGGGFVVHAYDLSRDKASRPSLDGLLQPALHLGLHVAVIIRLTQQQALHNLMRRLPDVGVAALQQHAHGCLSGAAGVNL